MTKHLAIEHDNKRAANKTLSFSDLIVRLGIDGFKTATSQTMHKLVQAYPTPESLFYALEQGLIDDTTKEGKAWCEIAINLKDDHWQKTLFHLNKVGVTWGTSQPITALLSSFQGKSVVVTGSLNNFSRTEIEDKLLSLGAKVSKSVSKKTNYVIAGEAAGSKLTDALKLGVRILTEEEFMQLVESGGVSQ